MNWQKVGNIVGQAAPWVGSLLGGPAGAAVGGLVASVLGTDATPEAVSRELVKNPDAFIKVREIETTHAAKLAELASADYQAELNTSSSVVIAEAKGESWLQRNWRPLLMLWFAILVGAHWLGFTAPGLSDVVVLSLLSIVKVGIGGYIVGRTGEKISREVAGFLDRKKQNVT